MFQLPAGSSPALSPPPAAAFLADMAVAGAGALGPRTPMHGWGGGLLRDDAILMGGPRRRQSVVQLPYSYCVGGGGDDSVTRTEVGVCGAIRRELQETRNRQNFSSYRRTGVEAAVYRSRVLYVNTRSESLRDVSCACVCASAILES